MRRDRASAAPLAAALAALAAACAGRPPTPQPALPAAEPAPAAAAEVAPACPAFAAPGRVRRSTIRATIDGGLGRWLTGVDVAAALEGGRFRGWRINTLYAGDPCYRDLDLRPGDVVIRVNGAAVERPEQANEVFVGLGAAPALTVDYVRDGQPRTLTLGIADD